MEKKYLLSMTELLTMEETDSLWKECIQWLDSERKLRMESQKRKEKKAEGIGAGLLLQLAVLEQLAEEQSASTEEGMLEQDIAEVEVIDYTLSNLLKRLKRLGKDPLPLEYEYKENGKPYLKNFPYYFNLSHSHDYIFCVMADREIGVDIELRKPLKSAGIWQRFFAESEKQLLKECSCQQEREKLFYRLWTGKEAYGKLTGKGIGEGLGFDVWEVGRGKCLAAKRMESEERAAGIYELESYEIDDYQIAVCKWKQEKKPL